jgi:molecular chaperone HtpG
MKRKNLEEALITKPDGSSLLQNLGNIRARVQPLLSRIVETFPDYTIHDIRHSDKVIEKMNEIIPGQLKDELNAYEIFFIIASGYLHDIGMVDFPELLKKEEFKEFEEKIQAINSKINNEELRKAYIRENHHLRSEEFIVTHFRDLGITDEHQARIIGRICRGHRKENLDNRELFEPEKMYKKFPINIPLLAGVLRIADELDLTFERVPFQMTYNHTSTRDSISKEEWEKHLDISGVGLSPEDPSTIICSAVCKNHKIHHLLKSLEGKIERELENLPDYLFHYREHRRFLPRKFLMKIQNVGYEYYEFKFSLQEEVIINLLMGEKMYKHKEECLRELLKNSVDGCRYRKEMLEKSGLSYKPEIVFKLTSAGDSIIVNDNGIGMDDDIIERYLTKIGKSFYQSPDFLEKQVDFTPVSELGIGILSCFMIANRIKIETKTEDSEPLLIEIDDISDYFFVRKGKRRSVGTSAVLLLKENVGEDIDLRNEICKYARHLEFPVRVILEGKEEFVVRDLGFKPTARDRDLILHKLYLIQMNENYIEGVIGLMFGKDRELGLRPMGVHRSRSEEESILSIEGIFIGYIDILPTWIEKGLVSADLNLKRKAVDLNVARNDIICNEKLSKIKKFIENILIDEFADFLKRIEARAEKSIEYDSREVLNDFFETYVRAFPHPMKEDFRLPQGLLDLIREYYHFTLVSKNGIKFARYDDIKDQPICILSDLYNYENEHIRQILFGLSNPIGDKSYIAAENYKTSGFAKWLFGEIKRIRLLSHVEMEESNELNGMIPKTWKLVRFLNFESDRLVDFPLYSNTFVNRDNRFIRLLVENVDVIKGDRRMAIVGFFRSLKLNLKNDFQEVTKNQKEILNWFVEIGVIKKDEMDFYVLTPTDFAPHLLKRSGS